MSTDIGTTIRSVRYGENLAALPAEKLLDVEKLAHVHHQLSALTGLRWTLVREGLHANRRWTVLEGVEFDMRVDVQIVIEMGADLLPQSVGYFHLRRALGGTVAGM